MTSKRDKEILRQSAEDGDALAERALGDAHEEEGLPPMATPGRGDWVVLWTGMYYHCGRLTGVDHEYYGLAAGSMVVYDTGELETFFGRGIAAHCEAIPTATYVRKGPTVNVSLWPFPRVCRRADGEV